MLYTQPPAIVIVMEVTNDDTTKRPERGTGRRALEVSPVLNRPHENP
jgi:hypothetical protein